MFVESGGFSIHWQVKQFTQFTWIRNMEFTTVYKNHHWEYPVKVRQQFVPISYKRRSEVQQSHKIQGNKHSDACIYLPPYKLDVLKIVEYKFSCEMEAHVEVTTSLMFDCNTFKDKRHLLILVAITLPSKELQFCNFIMQ